jgi:hypothetical protein
MIAVCGLGCYECGAFLATKENDDQKRAKVAQEWSKLFKLEVKPEDIRRSKGIMGTLVLKQLDGGSKRM